MAKVKRGKKIKNLSVKNGQATRVRGGSDAVEVYQQIAFETAADANSDLRDLASQLNQQRQNRRWKG